jgi:predicted transposase/invertase (TIGR01784 family)
MHVEHPSQSFERVLRLIPEVPDETERDLVVGTMLALGEHALSAEQRIQLQKELRLVSKIAEELYQEGLQEGRQKGLQEGRQEGLATVAERMFRKGASLADVVDMTGLSPAEAKAIQDKLVH